jgi:hypothetical protein
VGDDSNFKPPSNIAGNPGNVPFSAMLSGRSAFDTFFAKTMTGEDDFRVRSARIRLTRMPRAKSLLAKAPQSA